MKDEEMYVVEVFILPSCSESLFYFEKEDVWVYAKDLREAFSKRDYILKQREADEK
jgi:hypothetical protein